MAKSLLAHLYTRIKGSQEDIATVALHYLLTQSPALNSAFTRKIASVLKVDFDDTVQYSTQVTGENDERPDMTGVDENGKEIVVCEMKFYAGLTPNQPLGYLDRLIANGGKALLFVCPESRIWALWHELKMKCVENQRKIEDVDKLCMKVDDITMSIISWDEIIECLINTAEATAEKLIPDIKQLKGYCEQIDEDTFVPFRPEELTAVNAKKEQRFYTIIDKVTDLLVLEETLKSVKISSKAGNYYGYNSYVFVNNCGIGICYDRWLWENEDTIDTPFWLYIKDQIEGKKWNYSEDILRLMKKYPESERIEYKSIVYLALKVRTYATEDEVCRDIKDQILKYIKDVEYELNKKR